MSSISVVQYSAANTSPKLMSNVLQQNSSLQNKMDSGRREVIVVRKSTILPQRTGANRDDILITNPARKKHNTCKTSANNSQTVAVARRNARERNRVKQVNNGFANLRQHIPAFVAAHFESSSGRGGAKKLSKVETLRMAVEYIRSLEQLLAIDKSGDMSDYAKTESVIKSNMNSFEFSEDDSTELPAQDEYLKNATFEMISHYEDGENLDPLADEERIMSESSGPFDGQNVEFKMNQDLSYLNSIQSVASLSPGLYSDQSLSPSSMEKSDTNCFIPVFKLNASSPDSKLRFSAFTSNDLPVLSLKTENDLKGDHKDNVIDVIQWWEQQQHQPESIAS